MAILVMEGFEGYGNATDLRRRYVGSSAAGNIDIVTGRDGSGQAIRIDFGSSYLYFNVTGSTNTVVLGFGFRKINSMSVNDIVILFDEDGASEQVSLQLTALGELSVFSGATLHGTTSGVGMLTNTWYYIELSIVFGDATAGSVTLHVNGNQELNVTGIDTRVTAGENCALFRLQGDSSNFHEFDDLYFLDNSGTDQTTRIGPCFIETVFPDANGTTVNFTPSAGSNWQNVDDGNAPDDDTTYNSSSTLNQKDLYGHAALTGNIGTVYAVKASAHVRTEGGGARGIQNVARSSATEVNGTEVFIDQSYTYVDHIYENDPNGGGAWTESSVNAAEFGIEISS